MLSLIIVLCTFLLRALLISSFRDRAHDDFLRYAAEIELDGGDPESALGDIGPLILQEKRQSYFFQLLSLSAWRYQDIFPHHHRLTKKPSGGLKQAVAAVGSAVARFRKSPPATPESDGDPKS